MPPAPQHPRHAEVGYTQNFLHSPALVRQLVALARIPDGATVFEPGPGKGIITRALAEAVGTSGRVHAVELDATLAARLTETFAALPQVSITRGDVLHFDMTTLPAGYVMFANVPFNITSALLEHAFTPHHGPTQAHLILQRETLIPADVPDGGMTFKALMIAPWYHIAAVHAFRRTDFTPPPAVDTALFAFERRTVPLIDGAHHETYLDFLAAVSKDRAGEGVWRRIFGSGQIARLIETGGLVGARGLKAQTVEGISAAFRAFMQGSAGKRAAVTGAMAALREEQARRENINRMGGHRRRRN